MENDENGLNFSSDDFEPEIQEITEGYPDFEGCEISLIRTEEVAIKVDSYDLLMGWGKTTLILELAWSAIQGKSEAKLLIAFKTRKSILEFLWRLRERITNKDGKNANRYEERFSLLFDLNEEDADEIAAEFYKFSGNKAQLKYLKRLRADTSPKFIRDSRVRLVITTHETAARTASDLPEFDAVFDEVPDWVMILKDRYSDEDDEMLKKISKTKSEEFAAARGLQKKLETGMFSEFEVGSDKDTYKRAWIFNGSIKWKSMSIFAAFPDLTDLFICAKAFPGKFVFENLNPEANRRAALDLITWEKTGDANANFTLCSERKQKAAHKEMERIVKEKNGMMIHYKKNHTENLPCITNGTTGLNCYRGVNVVGVAAIKFKKPWVSDLCGQFFNSLSEQKEWEAKVAAAISLQGIFRTAIRDGRPITVCYIDDRTKEYITKILTTPGGMSISFNQAVCKEVIPQLS